MADSEGYQLVKELGTGLSGSVYLSEHESGQVAVRRFISTSQPGSREWKTERSEFLEAARQAAGLDQPRIIKTLEVIDDGDEAFVAMEFVTADTLESVLKSETFTPEQANHLLRKIALTLDYAHRQGVIHGDLKPSNIFVMADRSVKVGDFAISPRARKSRSHFPPEWSHPYLSPEHFAPENLGPRSDQYSLACIAYHLYTGQPPFAGNELRSAILFGQPLPPSTVRRNFPLAVDAVILKALSRNPDDRYGSDTELLDNLDAAINRGAKPAAGSRPSTPVMPMPAKRTSSKLLFIETALALAAILIAAFLYNARREADKKIAPIATISVPTTPEAELTTTVAPPVQPKPKPSSVTAVATPPTPVPITAPTSTPPVARIPSATVRPAVKDSPPNPSIESSPRARAERPNPRQPDPPTNPTTPAPEQPKRPEPMSPMQANGIDLAIFSRTRKIEPGLSFSYRDPGLGELAHGDLKALVQSAGPAPKGKLILDWVVDDVPMDSKFVTPNRLIEYGNEPTAGTYRVILRLDNKQLKSLVFRITP